MKKIRSDEFCYLAKSELFLTWLRNLDAGTHADLMNFLLAGHGCAENRVKMYEILRTIIKNNRWAVALESFLSKNYPAMIIDDTNSGPRGVSREGENKHKVFVYYDPALATLPRRIIFFGGDLQKKIRDFCARQFYCEWIIIEDSAYIEYIQPEAASHKSEIPAKNWQIRSFKQKSRA